MLAQSYVDFCEKLWSDWLKEGIKLPSDVSERFQLDYAPEPYLLFGEGSTPLYILLTNPGKGKDFPQGRKAILEGRPCVNREMPYQQVALKLGQFYRDDAKMGLSAKRRIKAMDHLKQLLNADCVVQFESLPFHSPSLSGKERIPALVERTGLLADYATVLRNALRDISVIAISAVNTSKSISVSSIFDTPWLSWQASLLGIKPDELDMKELVKKSHTVTSAFLYKRVDGQVRGFVLTMGGNNLPGEEGRQRLQQVIRGDAI